MAGLFPQNRDSPGRHPIFIDADGRACAVAYLMTQSGATAAAQAVARRENNAYVPDMRSPELLAWLPQSGLTLDEAAWIQPAYDFCPQCDCEWDPVCGANGLTYRNRCYAACLGALGAAPGCCANFVYYYVDACSPPTVDGCVPSPVTPTPAATPSPLPHAEVCWGDCDADRVVTIDEILTGVKILLGEAAELDCPAIGCRSACGPGPHDGRGSTSAAW
jgi:hypothetical protein